MKLELGSVIIDTLDGCNDIGLVIGIEKDNDGTPLFRVHWVCKRPAAGDYTTTLLYSESDLGYAELEIIG